MTDSIYDRIFYYRIVPDPLLTQNAKKAGRTSRKQRKIHRANSGKKGKSEPKRLRFCFVTTCGPEGQGGESITAYQNFIPAIRFCCNRFCSMVR